MKMLIIGQRTKQGNCSYVSEPILSRCGDGFGEENNYLCGQNMSPWDCVADPGRCEEMKNTNMYGYPAHFDLQNANLQITEGLGWNNPEVTWEQVDCSLGDFGDWESDCYCPQAS